MGNSASAAQRHPEHSTNRPQPRRRPSIDLPDLANQPAATAAPANTAAATLPVSVPAPRPPASAPIAIPQPVPHPHASTSYHPPVHDERDLPLDSAMPDVLLATPPPLPDLHNTHHHARPANRHIRGAPLQYNSTRSFAHPQVPPHQNPNYQNPNQPPAFVPEDVHSTIPLALRKAEQMRDDELLHPREDTARREPTAVCITYHGPANTVDLIRAGDANWKRKQGLEYDSTTKTWSTWVPLLPGTHHIRFIVDGSIVTTADNLPTAVDDNGTIANYVAVPISGFTPQTAARALHRRATSAKRQDSFFGHGRENVHNRTGERDPSVAAARAKSKSKSRHRTRLRSSTNASASSSSSSSSSDSESEPRWTTTLPWQLESAAEEEEMWLAQQAQIQAQQIHGYQHHHHPHPSQRMMVPPQHPQAPQLPRHLEKLIMNQRPNLGGAGGAGGAGGSGGSRRYQYGALAMTSTDIMGNVGRSGGMGSGGANGGAGGAGGTTGGGAGPGAPSTINLPITTASGTNILSKDAYGPGMSMTMTKASGTGSGSGATTTTSTRGREASPAPSNSTVTGRDSSNNHKTPTPPQQLPPSSNTTPTPTPATLPPTTNSSHPHPTSSSTSTSTQQYIYAPPLTSDDTSVLPVPSHVVLSHLGTSAIRNAMIAVCDTTRYRKKYLTVVYYKPA